MEVGVSRLDHDTAQSTPGPLVAPDDTVLKRRGISRVMNSMRNALERALQVVMQSAGTQSDRVPAAAA